VRATGFSLDTGQIHPNILCIARAWPAAELPAAISCVGGRDRITTQRAAIEASLTAATEPGATAHDVVRAAATAQPTRAAAHSHRACAAAAAVR
jgi:hypothetical protein